MSVFRKSTYVSLAALALAAGACAEVDEEGAEADVLVGDPDMPIDSKMDTTDWKVEDAVRRVCSTAAVAGLAEQLVDELECMQPGLIARIDQLPGVTLSAGTRPYLQGSAARALARAGQNRSIQVNSGLRTLPQQFLLHQWYARGLCTSVVKIAARPGRSNHESGLAIDVSNHGGLLATLRNQGFRWAGNSDKVHFDYKNGTDLRALSVRAFQRLHNLNSDTTLGVDGAYGPRTEGALKQAPASGYAVGSTCQATSRVAVDVSWSPLGDDHVALSAVMPADAAEVELWVGGELVAVLEADAPGALATAIAEVATPGPQLLEAVARDADGRVLGRGLDYLETRDLETGELEAD